MKKILTGALALVMIVSIVGCGIAGDIAMKSNGEVVIEDMNGKTLQDAINSGYNFYGYHCSDGQYQLNLYRTTGDEHTEKLISDIQGKTVAQMRKKYSGFSINLFKWGDNFENHRFSSYLGTVEIQYDIDNGIRADKLHDNESFFDLEEAEEVQNDVLKNIKLLGIEFYADIDSESNKKLNEKDELSVDDVRNMAGEIVLTKVYYRTK